MLGWSLQAEAAAEVFDSALLETKGRDQHLCISDEGVMGAALIFVCPHSSPRQGKSLVSSAANRKGGLFMWMSSVRPPLQV